MKLWMQTKPMRWLATFCRGIFMGIADLVPGVSGGTIAFALGVHPDLLKSLKTLNFSSIRHPSQVAWFFLSAILFGVLFSLALGSHLIYYLLNHELHQSLLRALFLGLILGSIFYCSKKIESWNLKRSLSLVVGVLIALSIPFMNLSFVKTAKYDVPIDIHLKTLSNKNIENYDEKNKELKNVNLTELKALVNEGYLKKDAWIYHQNFQKFVQVDSCLEFTHNSFIDFKLILAGALAICAMLLPGISGSQVFQIFGCYEPIIEAIALWTKQLTFGSIINPSFWVLFNTGIGILLGIAFFSRFFIFMYRKYYYATLSLLVGFMLGSVPTLWPFWSLSYKVHLNPSGPTLLLQRVKPLVPRLFELQTWLVGVMVIVGMSILLLLEKIEVKKQQSAE